MLLERAVVNAGPLVGLSMAGRLDLLPALFAEFWIPETVFHEVAIAGLGRPGADTLTDARWTAHANNRGQTTIICVSLNRIPQPFGANNAYHQYVLRHHHFDVFRNQGKTPFASSIFAIRVTGLR